MEYEFKADMESYLRMLDYVNERQQKEGAIGLSKRLFHEALGCLREADVSEDLISILLIIIQMEALNNYIDGKTSAIEIILLLIFEKFPQIDIPPRTEIYTKVARGISDAMDSETNDGADVFLDEIVDTLIQQLTKEIQKRSEEEHENG